MAETWRATGVYRSRRGISDNEEVSQDVNQEEGESLVRLLSAFWAETFEQAMATIKGN